MTSYFDRTPQEQHIIKLAFQLEEHLMKIGSYAPNPYIRVMGQMKDGKELVEAFSDSFELKIYGTIKGDES